jgi:hypothetical protein
MSLLHCDEPPEAGANDALTVKGHWLGRQFRVNSGQYPYHQGAELAGFNTLLGGASTFPVFGMRHIA